MCIQLFANHYISDKIHIYLIHYIVKKWKRICQGVHPGLTLFYCTVGYEHNNSKRSTHFGVGRGLFIFGIIQPNRWCLSKHGGILQSSPQYLFHIPSVPKMLPCLFRVKLKTTVFTESVLILSKFSYLTQKFRIKYKA